MKFSGKTVLVTGGNSGIGRGIVHRFVAEGAEVAIAGRDPAKGARVCAEVGEAGGGARFFEVDLARESAVEKLIQSVERQFGKLDVVVNNAGVGSRRSAIGEDDSPGARWDKLRGPNLDSAYFTAAYALPLLKRSGAGAIVNISSTATLHGNWGLYCVAKAGVEALTRALAVEGAPHRIRANCVSPGWIATEKDESEPASGSSDGQWVSPPSLFHRMGTPTEIASAVIFLASPEASFITGQTLIVDGGMAITDYTSLPLLQQTGQKLFSGRL
jgi:NAD(P)-dependent dehydrogenase (short-subunit alcohol dehydrogenase family)